MITSKTYDANEMTRVVTVYPPQTCLAKFSLLRDTERRRYRNIANIFELHRRKTLWPNRSVETALWSYDCQENSKPFSSTVTTCTAFFI